MTLAPDSLADFLGRHPLPDAEAFKADGKPVTSLMYEALTHLLADSLKATGEDVTPARALTIEILDSSGQYLLTFSWQYFLWKGVRWNTLGPMESDNEVLALSAAREVLAKSVGPGAKTGEITDKPLIDTRTSIHGLSSVEAWRAEFDRWHLSLGIPDPAPSAPAPARPRI
jgi:hypothetical protein